jgi:hypothetical protein
VSLEGAFSAFQADRKKRKAHLKTIYRWMQFLIVDKLYPNMAILGHGNSQRKICAVEGGSGQVVAFV